MITFLPDIAEEHYEELQFLWLRRENALRSPAYTLRELARIEERIEAHVQGLLVVPEEDLATLLEPGLVGEDEMPAFASAYALLRAGTSTARARVLDGFVRARGKALSGIRQALSVSPASDLQPALLELFQRGPVPVAVAAGEATVFQGALRPQYDDLVRFFAAAEPAVRSAAWRIITNAAVEVPAELYERGLHDDDAGVKRAAVMAAAWGGYSGFVRYCQSLVVSPSSDVLEALMTLAAFAPARELPSIAALAASPPLGGARLRIAAAFGHPALMDLIIGEMENADPAVSASAGAAFLKMTGIPVYSDRRAKLTPAGADDDFEAEFADEVLLPDPIRARKHWDTVKAELSGAERICRGFDLTEGIVRETFAALDLESRWELCLRARLTKGWTGTPVSLQRYPQRA